MHALSQMATTQKERRRSQVQFDPRSCDGKQRGNVVFTSRGQSHDLRIHKLFAGKPGLGEKPPHPRMKPERGGHKLFNNGDQPVHTAHVKQFVTGNPVLRRGTQFQERFGQQNNGAKKPDCRGTAYFR
jgi:hypothetical protein